MKNRLPLILLGLGALVVLVAFLTRGQDATSSVEEEDIPELPFSQRPYTKLVPTKDGYYLKLMVSNFNVPGAASMDYELYYGTAEGITQGVPGKVSLDGKDSIERELLLGSESAGKFRYDKGVDDGTLTLRFRDADGKLIGKIAGQWALLNDTSELKSLDGKFVYTLEKKSKAYFVVMPTFGLPSSTSFEVASGPYGVFASTEDDFPGDVSWQGNIYGWYGDGWKSVSGSSDNVGVFVTSN